MKNIPEFSNKSEIADFFETHDTTEFDFSSWQETFQNPEKKPVTIRLNQGYIDLAKELAKKKGMGYQTLIRSWIAERLLKESKGF
jgi:predicted DNA binding CopG/RHH family protein